MELVCPAGNPAALRAAVEAGADAAYVGFRDETNARNFPGLNFSPDELRDGIRLAHDGNCKVYVAVNTFPRAGAEKIWRRAVANAVDLGADAVILADIGLLADTARRFPKLRIHLSVQAGASHAAAIDFYAKAFGVRRVVLPRMLTVAEIATLNRTIAVETETFAYSVMCPMAEGRCALSAYVTGESANAAGVCSPTSQVRYERDGDDVIARLGGSIINRFHPDETAGYPTLCKGRFIANGEATYLFEEPASLNTATILAELKAAGVTALKIEGRQRGRAYIASVVASFRALLDALESGREVPAEVVQRLDRTAEGRRLSAGAYERRWR
ncbi:MAG: U32 family peptidase [Alphaproteobacteria bacterium]|nr:U32 family peptidase [Alphaproteobacteria bacterium]